MYQVKDDLQEQHVATLATRQCALAHQQSRACRCWAPLGVTDPARLLQRKADN